jgi:predicted HD superfamily hydrolase involved in NAD metabolism
VPAHEFLAFTALARRVREHLSQQDRYAHSVHVARCADLLAQRHGIDARRARLAGMLHDLARLYSASRLIEESQARGFIIQAYERAHPVLLHARLGAAIARELFGVDDAEVLSAIEKHTTGSADMSPLDCVVYLADSLEPGRTFAERAALWQLAMRDLTAAMREVLTLTLRHQARKGKEPAEPTLAAAQRFGARLPKSVPEVSASAS